MRYYILPKRYFLILILIIVAMMGMMVVADLITSGKPWDLTVIIESPWTNTLAENIYETLFFAIIILILYSAGVYFIVRKIQDEVSRFTAVRIFLAILIGLAFFFVLISWVEDPGQIALIIGIIWGALLVSLRDLIQNMVGSLILLFTRVYRIGDRIYIRGVYGVVMDIGVFRTTLMRLDEKTGDRPTGKITTVPNGVLFREVVTNESRDLSFTNDEIRLTLPLSADIEKARAILLSVIQKHTGDVRERAIREIERLGERKFLPDLDVEPVISVQIDRQQILVIANYCTDARRGPEIKNGIVQEISGLIPGIMEAGR